MPTQYDMNEDTILYRAILEHDVQPTRKVPNPDYDPNARFSTPDFHKKEMWKTHIRVPDGPVVTKEMVIGPYQSIAPMKSYVTRNRSRHGNRNLRIKRIERVSAWEEVDY